MMVMAKFGSKLNVQAVSEETNFVKVTLDNSKDRMILPKFHSDVNYTILID